MVSPNEERSVSEATRGLSGSFERQRQRILRVLYGRCGQMDDIYLQVPPEYAVESRGACNTHALGRRKPAHA